jgi:hypothetical protein
MSISFPTSPSIGQIYVLPTGESWKWNGSAWQTLGSPGPTGSGPAGVTGPTGPQGIQGPTGSQGLHGSTGPTGSLSISGTADNGILTLNGSSPNVSVESTLRYDGISLILDAQSGDEGGQILLNKPVTNTSINTGIYIDIYQNKIRFFEGGGSSRGGYIDITDMQNSVGVNLAPYRYLYVTRSSSNQTIPSGNWSNRDIIFNNQVTSLGIPYNTSTGVATLSPGTYRISSKLAWSAAATYLFQWSCYTNSNSQLGPTVEQIQSTNSSNNLSPGDLDFIYTANSLVEIKIRTNSSTNALSGEYIRFDLNTSLIIQQIG